tara:strand:- start:158 stop:715 length:558 start_codon:yes stop_codon:yes gene_type:complete
MFLIVFIGFLYLVIGFISLFTALLFIEIGRPRDLIQSGLLILLGIFLIIYKNIFTFKISLVLTLNAVLIGFYIIENYSFRWNQLLEKEKFNIKSLSGLKQNFSIIYKIIRLDFENLNLNNKIKNIFKNTSIKKKWVRGEDKIINSTDKEASSKQYMTNNQKADFFKKDIINDEKNNIENTKIDKQ